MNAALLLALAVLAMAAHSALATGEIVTLLPLDETSGSKARDIGSADNDATYVNGPLLGQPGFQSPFLSVKLSPDYRQYISVPHDSAYESLTDACVLLWVKPRALWSGYSGLFSKGDNLVVYLDRNGYVVARFTAGGSSVTLVSADPISLGSWHAVQVCWGSSGAELYVDSNSNVVRNTRFTGSPFSGNRNAPAVGALCWSSRSAGFSSGEVNSFLNGWVEAFTIYNRQITLSRLSGWVLQALSPTTTTTTSTTKTTTTSTKTTTTSTTTTKTTTTSTTTTGPSTTSTTKTTTTSTTTTSTTTTKTTTTSTTTTSTTTTSTTTTTTAFSTASASIIALLPLNDTTGSTAFDVIGDHDGRYQNSPAFGKDGPFSGTSAVRLNPKDRTYVSLPDSTDFRLTEACILLWFYPRSSGSPFGLIGKGDNLVVQLKRDGCLLVRLRDRSVSGRTETTMVSPAPLAVNRWYEVVVCFGPAGATLFINGARVASSSFAGSPLWGNSAPFVLGAINNADGALSRRTLSDGAHDTFNGRLFGFLIYGQQQTSSPVVVENALLAGLDGKFVNPTTTTTAAATTSTTAAPITSTTTTAAPTTSSTTTTSTTTTTTSTTETRPPTTTSLGNSTSSSSTTTTTTTSTTTTTTTRTTTTSTTLLTNSTTPAGNSTTAI